MKRQNMKRQLVALGASAALLSFGGAAALANGSHSSAPSINTASQSSSNTQILGVSLGLGVAAPVNASVPVSALSSGSNGGDVEQRGDATAEGQAKNNETVQTIRQETGRDGGSNSASQSSSNTQVLPVAIGAGVAAPINANVPVSALSSGSNNGDVKQGSQATGSGRGVNVEHDQDIVQSADKGAKNTASQSASNMQVLPIALGLGVAAPVNARVPVAALSSNSNNGDVKQRTDANARGEGLNNETEQEIRQSGSRKGSENTASQSADNSQVLAVALGPAVSAPVNANVPVALLAASDNNRYVDQFGDGDVFVESINNDTNQAVRQDDSQELVSSMLSNVADAMTEGSAVQKMLGGL